MSVVLLNVNLCPIYLSRPVLSMQHALIKSLHTSPLIALSHLLLRSTRLSRYRPPAISRNNFVDIELKTRIIHRYQSMNHSATATNFFDNKESANFLPPQYGRNRGKKTLVLDLDETLVHSSFQPVKQESLILPVSYGFINAVRLRSKDE